MNEKTVRNAEKAAKHFLESVKLWRHIYPDDGGFDHFGNKYSADIRRKSMDLTRALAEMRRF